MYFHRPQTDLRETLLSVIPCNEPAFVRAKRTKGPKRKGLIYQGQASEHLLQNFPSGATFGQWFKYRLQGVNRDFYCQIDCFIIDYSKPKITIVEIKLKHCIDAYYQLFELYLPILQHYYGKEFEYACVEFVSSFDKAIPMPQSPKLLKRIEEAHPKDFSVHIWTPWKYEKPKQHQKSIPLEL